MFISPTTVLVLLGLVFLCIAAFASWLKNANNASQTVDDKQAARTLRASYALRQVRRNMPKFK